MFCGSVHAVPAQKGIRRTLTLADGTTVVAELKGDEWMHYWQAADGQAYVLDGNKKNVFVKADLQSMARSAEARRNAVAEQRSAQFEKTKKMFRASKAGRETTKRKGLILLVSFSDKQFNALNTRDFYIRMANQEGFGERGAHGSIRDYFLSQSNNAFDITFDVVGPLQMANGFAYYGGSTQANPAGNAYKMVVEACKAADKDVNFADYDWDGDGKVDNVVVVFAGPGYATGGGEGTIWPHEGGLSAFGESLSLDGASIDTYACSNEIVYPQKADGSYDKTVENPAGIGILCHEFSHCLGMPDMYDTGGQRYYGMNVWSVMDQGCYAGGTYIPVNYTAFERIFCGWQTPIVLSEAATVKGLGCSADYATPLIIKNDIKDNEFYVLENRQPRGWDAGLAGYGRGGLVVTHVDYSQSFWRSNKVNNVETLGNNHRRCTIFHADNSEGTAFGNDTAEIAGDAYPYIVDGAVANNSLTDDSEPAAQIYNKNYDADIPDRMGKPVTNIALADDGTVSFDFMGGSSDNIITAIAHTPVADSSIVRVYDAFGRMVISAPSSIYTDASLPSGGVYIVKKGAQTRKVVRN